MSTQRSELLLEPNQGRRIDAPHGLERNQLTALLIVGFVDHPHSAGTEPANERESHLVEHHSQRFGFRLQVMLVVERVRELLFGERHVRHLTGAPHPGDSQGGVPRHGVGRSRALAFNLSVVMWRFTLDGLSRRFRNDVERVRIGRRVRPSRILPSLKPLAIDER